MATLENNKLLAEFIGKKVITRSEFNPSIHTGEDLVGVYEIIEHTEYHRNWNWLMPIVMQINIIDNYRYTIQINSMDVYIYDNLKGGYIFMSECKWQPDELLNSVYEAIVEFIKWYNKQNKN